MNAYQIASLPYFGYPDVPPDAYHGTKALVLEDDNKRQFAVARKDEDAIAEAIWSPDGMRLVGVGIILDCDTLPMDSKDWRFMVAFTDGSGTL